MLPLHTGLNTLDLHVGSCVVKNHFPHQMLRFALLVVTCIAFSQVLTILNSGVSETNDWERRLHPRLTTLDKMIGRKIGQYRGIIRFFEVESH